MICCACNIKIHSYNTIYKGFDMNFCSNMCRTKYYNKIIKYDPKIKKYNEWENICCKNIYCKNIYNENKKVKKTHSIKNLYSLDSIKIENNENAIENTLENVLETKKNLDIYNNINIYNFICSNNSYHYINELNNINIQENKLDNNILIFTKNLDYSIITKYIIYPVILFCKYIYINE